MRLLVGLGNPGSEYQRTRHNVGFMAVDEIVHRFSFSDWKKKFHGLISQGHIQGQKVLVLKPQTFMNRSGISVQEVCRFYKIAPEDVFVFYDDLDLTPGKIRLKQGGGSGGHNGIKSIDALACKDYWRVRLGIGRPVHKSQVHSWVLGAFHQDDQVWLKPFLENITQELPDLLGENKEAFVSRIMQKSL